MCVEVAGSTQVKHKIQKLKLLYSKENPNKKVKNQCQNKKPNFTVF